MIFVSIGLLVVAGVTLIIGIVASSVPPLVISILVTLAAAVMLWASFVHYRKEAAESGLPVLGLGGNQPRNPGYPEVYQSSNGHSAPPSPVHLPPRPAQVPPDWDELDKSQAIALVTTFNLDDLHEVRRHEVEHGFRPTVMAEIDQRISTIVEARRRSAAPRRPHRVR